MGKMFNIIIIKIFDPQSHTVSIICHTVSMQQVFFHYFLYKKVHFISLLCQRW